MGCCSRFTNYIDKLTERYALLIVKNPFKVAITYFVISVLLTLIGFYYGLETVSRNPHAGFETRGTEMANERLMLSILGGKIMSPQKLLLYNRDRIKREASGEPTESTLNFTINYDDYGKEELLSVDEITSGCAQYFALGKYYPNNVIDLLTKAIFKIDSFDKAFSLKVMKRLCELDDIIDETVHRTQVSTFRASLPYSFNLPHYALCINSTYTKKCEHLNEKDLQIFKDEILKCADEKFSSKGICNTTVAQQLRYFIIEQKANSHSSPIYIGAVQLYSGWSSDSNLFYSTLFDELKQFYSSDSSVQLKGISMNFKEKTFMDYLIEDCYLALAAILAVVFIVIITHGLLFSIVLVLGMLLSIGVAFFIYVIVLQIHFFPFINLLAILISLAISFDNAFLLAFQYKNAVKSVDQSLRNDLFDSCLLDNTENQRFGMKIALGHAGFSMLVADFTTIVAFLTNCTSNIIVLKCFGIFASLTIATNFIFSISAMPAIIMLIESRGKSKHSFIPLKWTRCTKSIGNSLKNFIIYTLPRVVNHLKLAILIGSSLLFAFSLYSMLVYPCIRLPDNNPLQLLRSSHPFEWFDENELNMFDFSHYRMRQMNFYVIFGVSKAYDASNFEPSNMGQISYDNSFKINNQQKLKKFENLLEEIHQSDLVENSQKNASKLWITELIDYSKQSNGTCSKNDLDFNLCVKEFAKKVPVFGFPDDFSMSFKDGPLFDDESETLIGYFAIVPSHYRLLFVYSQIQPFVQEMQNLKEKICHKYSNDFPCPIFVPGEHLAKMDDLLSILLNSTLISVLICVAVCMLVIMCTTRHLLLSICVVLTISVAICLIISIVLWLGWYINVVEATIVIITIGLSFDYTLHMAVSFKMTPLHLSALERMVRANFEVYSPIFLAAFTNLIGGTVLIWAKTQPFYEIGVFLIAVSIISYLSAIILFPALVFCCYGVGSAIKRCD